MHNMAWKKEARCLTSAEEVCVCVCVCVRVCERAFVSRGGRGGERDGVIRIQ